MKWITFWLQGEQIELITVYGSFEGEIEATKGLLAYQYGVDESEISVKIEEVER